MPEATTLDALTEYWQARAALECALRGQLPGGAESSRVATSPSRFGCEPGQEATTMLQRQRWRAGRRPERAARCGRPAVQAGAFPRPLRA